MRLIVFQSGDTILDLDFFEVADNLGTLKNDNKILRHPLAYLVEAADDICYTLIDFEDGINLLQMFT